jgi:hypothetical protein
MNSRNFDPIQEQDSPTSVVAQGFRRPITTIDISWDLENQFLQTEVEEGETWLEHNNMR